MVGLLDSGAFSDSPEKRPTFEGALQRQLRWEQKASRFWQYPWQAEAVVSHDLLIDEKWTGLNRKKQRWSVAEAERAVRVTVDAAAFLASRRRELAPRKLVLACQGVDAIQYTEAAHGVLAHGEPGDWFGLGGFCIIGKHTKWLPTFWASIRRVLPLVVAKGMKHVHIFGVMFRPALGGLLWLADQHGLTVSTDSSGPVLSVTWKDKVKAGACAETWETNVSIWQERLANLRQSVFYREPPSPHGQRQLTLFGT